jgi:hypothetical protein
MRSHRTVDGKSRPDRRVGQVDSLGPSGPVALPRKPARGTLDFAAWRARIAAPGSRFTPAPTASTSARIVRFTPPARTAECPTADRRTA